MIETEMKEDFERRNSLCDGLGQEKGSSQEFFIMRRVTRDVSGKGQTLLTVK